MKITAKLWIGIVILVVLSPLGILLPEYFKAGPAWGEDKLLNLWNAPISDYAFKGWERRGLLGLSLGYILSAVTGIIAVVLVMRFITKILIKK